MENSLPEDEETSNLYLYHAVLRCRRASHFYFQHFSVPFPRGPYLHT